mgnify:CR=1 FL=1|tara:strand:- start:2303 stop:2497 length:195 start_codon:yes stop_codon:yes gene_type:complete
MSALTKILYTIAAAAAIVYITTTIFAFFDIGFETYGIYVLFIVGMSILYAMLPEETGLLFSPKD